MNPGTLSNLLAHAAASKRGLRLLDRKERATYYAYDEVRDRSLRMASWLRGQGVSAGDRVALILPTSAHFFDAFFGAVHCGAIPVPMYPPVRLGRLDEYHERTSAMLKNCDVRVVLTTRRIHRVLGRTAERTNIELGFVPIDLLDLTDLAAAEPVVPAPDDIAFIQFSSGTTARPKAIQLTHRAILANTMAIRDRILAEHPEADIGFEHSCVSWLPLYHDMGLVGCVFVAMSRPCDLTLIGPDHFLGRPAVWLRALSRYGGTVSPAPNFAYSLCAARVRDEELEGVDLQRWLVAMNGAEPVTPKVLNAFARRFAPFGFSPASLTPVYGLGEATLAVTFGSMRDRWRTQSFDREQLAIERRAVSSQNGGLELVSVGTPLPGYQVDIRAEGQPLPKGALGEVWIAGPSLMLGYRALDEENQRVWDGDWLNTGDCGFMNEGELFLYGRTKDTIVVRGRNVAAQDIEQALDGLAGVRAGCVAAVGVLGEHGEELLVLVETTLSEPEARATLAREAQAAVSARCSLTAVIEVLDKGVLPRTSS
ncbi:MAG: AMP-binding protein, partial [Myxococcota bacterium]